MDNKTGHDITDRRTKTKKQHYIPQFLIKNWSNDGEHIKLMTFNGDRTAKIICSAIKDAFEASSLYGKSIKCVEELFANKIEPDFQNAINDIRIKKSARDIRMQEYTLYQMCRTKFVVDICAHNLEIMLDMCFNENESIKVGIAKTEIQHLIEDEYGQNIGYKEALEKIVSIIEPYVKSLRKQKLIYSDTDLFIGENPVIVICPFNKPKLAGSILDPCSMILFPISPNEIIVLYRPEDCEVKDEYSLSKEEAHCFNSFQIQQTDRSIAFKNEFAKEEYEPYFKDGHDHKIITFPNGFQFFHTWQDLHFSGLDGCFRNIFDPKLNAYLGSTARTFYPFPPDSEI
jgi:hypothetical protein